MNARNRSIVIALALTCCGVSVWAQPAEPQR
jgi:hypothetical protein